ncbi:MAG: CNNM domain-containing protein [Longimicrobiales bacterium]|nr:CNNM domain-containing protein [Longimicrobiales bacterium]
MTVFIASVATVILVSALCSLSEASIYAVRRPFIRTLTQTGSAAGPVLESFKNNMERPIAAILIVNTAANTAGAAVAGAQASSLFGPESLIWFSILFTLGVLLISEIFPKILGVVYNRPVARLVALPWKGAIAVLTPLVWLVEHVSRWVKPAGQVFAAPEEEVMQFAQISADEGSISVDEAVMVRNVLALDDLTAQEMMTPRTVVFRLPATMTLREVSEHVDAWHHSRIPIYDPEGSDRWTGLVRSADVLARLASGAVEVRLDELARPLHFVPDTIHGHLLLQRFIEERTHLFAVVDEFGGMAGVVTLEDVFESLIGREIVDEVDQVADLREVARRRARHRRDVR